MLETLNPNRLRRRLLTAGAGALATSAFSRSVLAQAASVELPFINGKRSLVA